MSEVLSNASGLQTVRTGFVIHPEKGLLGCLGQQSFSQYYQCS